MQWLLGGLLSIALLVLTPTAAFLTPFLPASQMAAALAAATTTASASTNQQNRGNSGLSTGTLLGIGAVLGVGALIGLSATGIIGPPNCALTLGTAPGPCSFGGVVITPPIPCIGTGLFYVTILADIGITPVPMHLVVGPSQFLYYTMSHPGQFVSGVAQGQVGRCLTAPHTLLTGMAETGAPFVWPVAYYGTSI